MIVDAGILIALDRNDHRARRLFDLARRKGQPMRTSHGVVGQVWRDARQAVVARALQVMDLHAMTDGYRVGMLLASTGSSDVIDAHLALIAIDLGEEILTGDVEDLRRLVAAGGGDPSLVMRWPRPG